MGTTRKISGVALLAVLCAAAAELALVRAGRLAHPLGVIGALTALAVVLALVRAGATIVLAARASTRPAAALAEVVALAGLVVVLAGGVWNWARGFQGFVVLTEGDAVPLSGGAHLRDFRAGPLAERGALAVALKLEDVRFARVDGPIFSPESHLILDRAGGPHTRIVVRQGLPGAVGPLRLYQGAFGFSPRLVVEERGRTLLDEIVPFATRGDEAEGIAFEGSVSVPGRSIELQGRVSLAELDPNQLKGHPKLWLTVVDDGRRVGSSELELGHFVEVRPGLRVGLAGMPRWTEIDVSRRSYRGVMLAGAGTFVVGLLAWACAAWRLR